MGSHEQETQDLRLPILLLYDALENAKKGNPYASFAEDGGILDGLHLNTPNPDGKTLIERLFISPEGDLQYLPSAYRKFEQVGDSIIELIVKTKEKKANPQEWNLAHDLVMVGMLQYAREGNVCPFANTLLLYAPRECLPIKIRGEFLKNHLGYMAKGYATSLVTSVASICPLPIRKR